MEINKIFLTIIIIILVLIMGFVLVLPKYKELTSLQETLTNKKAEYEGKYIYYTKIDELTKNIEGKKDALEKVDSALPLDVSFAQILYFLQQKGVEAGLVVKSTIFSPPTALTPATATDTEQKVQNVSFTINLVGNYQGLKTFASSLEKSARLFQVTSISFNSLDTSNMLSASPTLAQLQSELQEKIYNFQLIIETNTY